MQIPSFYIPEWLLVTVLVAWGIHMVLQAVLAYQTRKLREAEERIGELAPYHRQFLEIYARDWEKVVIPKTGRRAR